MSFMRERVQPITSKPPPGRYEAPLKITLNSETPGVDIYFTLDGSVPVSNSDREHGFRCEHYKPFSGFVLRGGGVHVLTVVGQKKGCVATGPTKLKFVLTGSPFSKKKATLGDMIIERRFLTMASLDPPMPLRLARARSPALSCALVDTCPRAVLEDKIHNGEEVALFALTHSTRVVSRSDKYRRIVPPTLISIPPPLIRERTSLPASLRSTVSRAVSPLAYEHPSFLKPLPKDVQPRCHSSMSVRRPPIAAPQMVAAQLASFETRAELLPKPGEGEDAEEEAEAARYVEQCATIIRHEHDRMERLSEMFSKTFTKQIAHASDVASNEKDVMKIILIAKTFCRSEIKRLLCLLSYKQISVKLLKTATFVAADLAALCDNAISVVDLLGALKPISDGGVSFFNTRLFLLLCRYLIWTARPIPESIFGLTLNYWKQINTDLGAEPLVGKVTMLSILDIYRRTRGANKLAIEQLYQGFYSSLPWSESNEISSGMLAHFFTTHVSVIDAALVVMNDMSHEMYNETLPPWAQLSL